MTFPLGCVPSLLGLPDLDRSLSLFLFDLPSSDSLSETCDRRLMFLADNSFERTESAQNLSWMMLSLFLIASHRTANDDWGKNLNQIACDILFFLLYTHYTFYTTSSSLSITSPFLSVISSSHTSLSLCAQLSSSDVVWLDWLFRWIIIIIIFRIDQKKREERLRQEKIDKKDTLISQGK